MQTTIRYFENILERPIFFPLKNEEEGKEKIRENFQNTYSRSILLFFFFFFKAKHFPLFITRRKTIVRLERVKFEGKRKVDY